MFATIFVISLPIIIAVILNITGKDKTKERQAKRIKRAAYVSAFFAFCLVCTKIGESTTGEDSTPNDSTTIARNDSIERQKRLQNEVNAVERAAKRAIKKSLNDPDSYEHVESRFLGGDMISAPYNHKYTIQIRFRGTNAFGAKVLNSCTSIVEVDSLGNANVVSMQSDQ